MKSITIFLLIILYTSIFLSAVLLYLPAAEVFKVGKGSSLSSSVSPKKDHTYWVSPSGNFAFGFYPLCTTDCHDDPRYVVGIWLVKKENKTLVWSANRDDPPLNNLSSIFFDGNLILETKTRKKNSNQVVVNKRPLLPGVTMSAAYVKLHDNGNFVLYNHDSEIVWESFDHPTNTILGGQQLSAGQTLVSESSWWEHGSKYVPYTLGIESDNDIYEIKKSGNIRIRVYNGSSIYRSSKFPWGSNVAEPVTMNLDATDGRLYLVDGNDVVLQNITQGDENNCEHDSIIYRGTLDSDGIFRLYKERMMGSQGGKSILLWDTSRRQENQFKEKVLRRIIIILTMVVLILTSCLCCCTFPGSLEETKKVRREDKKHRRRT